MDPLGIFVASFLLLPPLFGTGYVIYAEWIKPETRKGREHRLRRTFSNAPVVDQRRIWNAIKRRRNSP